MDHTLAGADSMVLSLDDLDLATLLSLKDTSLGSILRDVVEQKVVENDALQEMSWRDRLIYKDFPHAWHSMHHIHHMHHQHHSHHMHPMNRQRNMHHSHSMSRW